MQSGLLDRSEKPFERYANHHWYNEANDISEERRALCFKGTAGQVPIVTFITGGLS